MIKGQRSLSQSKVLYYNYEPFVIKSFITEDKVEFPHRSSNIKHGLKPPYLFCWYLTEWDKARGFFQLSPGSKAVWGFLKPVIMFSKIHSSAGYPGPCKRTNLVIIRKSGFRSSVRATKWWLSDVCNSLTRSEIMLMWLKVPRWLCFRGTVMKNVLQSLEYSGSSF